MTIDYSVWPDDLIPYKWNFFLAPNSTRFTSPITRSSQVLHRQGELWTATGSFIMQRAESQRLDALLDMLQGGAVSIQLWDFSRPDPLGSNLASGVVEVNGVASAGDMSCGSEGWTINSTGVLLAGDLVSIDGYLYRLSQDASSDGSGLATLNFTSPLRSDVGGSPGSEVVRTKPTVSMRLIDDAQPLRSYDGGQMVNSYTLSFVEAW